MIEPRRFHLQRTVDVTGASGTGRVADGVQWRDGTVSIRWRGERPSVVFWGSIQDAEHVHGHGGASRIVWDDPETPDAIDIVRAEVRAKRAVILAAGREPTAEPATVALTIHITAPNLGQANRQAHAIADLVVAEHGHHMRLRTAITDPDYMPPPPGSDRDALPEHLRALIQTYMRPYTGTGCETARACELAAEVFPALADELLAWAAREHASCRITRKQDMALCQCDCHTVTEA